MLAGILQAQEKPVCAVLPFTSGQGIDIMQTSQINNRYRELVSKSGEYDVIPRDKMNRMIITRLPQKPAAVTPYYVIAGRILKADYIILGTVEHSDGKYWLKTALCDVQNEKVIKRVNIHHRGDIKTFLAKAAEANFYRLAGKKVKSKLAHTAAPPKTVSMVEEKIHDRPFRRLQKEPFDIRKFAKERIEAGLRVSYYYLLENNKESFLGSINELKEDQDYMPHPYISIKIMDPFWVSLGYNKLRAKTWTKPEPQYNEEGYTDGTIDLSGPFILLHYRKEINRMRSWFIETGFTIYDADFVHNPSWRDAGGFYDSHVMDFYDTYGLMMNAGINFDINKNWKASVFASYTRVSVDMTYYLYGTKRDERIFPLSNFAAGAGIVYDF